MGSLSHKLVAWRRKRRLTQREAAALLGVTQPTWCAWETGSVVPRSVYVRRLIEITDGEIRLEDFETDGPTKS
jgi:DNA-binding XRE family transcriptional regulator